MKTYFYKSVICFVCCFAVFERLWSDECLTSDSVQSPVPDAGKHRKRLSKQEIISRCQMMGEMLSEKTAFEERRALLIYREMLVEVVGICKATPGRSRFRRDRETVMKEILNDEVYDRVVDSLLIGLSSPDERIRGMSMLFLCKVLGSTAGHGLMIREVSSLKKRVCFVAVGEMNAIDKILLDCAVFIGDSMSLEWLKMLFASNRKIDAETLRFASRVLSEAGFPVAKFSPDSLLLMDPPFLSEAFGAVCADGMYYGYEKYGLWQINRLANKVHSGSQLSRAEKKLLQSLLVQFPRDVSGCKVLNLSNEQTELLHSSIIMLAKCTDSSVVEIAVKGVFSSAVSDGDCELLRSLLVNTNANIRSRAAYALAHRSVDCIKHCSCELIKMLEDDSIEARREAYFALKVGLKEPASNWESPATIARDSKKIKEAYER